MYKFIKIRHDVIKQCHVNYKEMKNFNYKLEIGIFRNSTQKYLGVLRGPKRHPDALLAKTMPHYISELAKFSRNQILIQTTFNSLLLQICNLHFDQLRFIIWWFVSQWFSHHLKKVKYWKLLKVFFLKIAKDWLASPDQLHAKSQANCTYSPYFRARNKGFFPVAT